MNGAIELQPLFLFDLNGLYGGFSRLGFILRIFKFGGVGTAIRCALRYKVCRKSYYELLRGEITEQAYWQSFIKGFGLLRKISAKLKEDERQNGGGGEDAVVQKLMALLTESILEIDSQMVELLAVLKQYGAVALLSDINKERVKELKKREEYRELFKQFKETYFSCYLGHTKRERELFKGVLGGLDVSPQQQVIFIDDHHANVRVARTVGIRAIYFRSPRQLRRALLRLALPPELRNGLKKLWRSR